MNFSTSSKSTIEASFPDCRRPHMSSRRNSCMTRRQFLANFPCVAGSSTQNSISPFFSGSTRKSLKERCSNRTGESAERGTSQTECSILNMIVMTSLFKSSNFASDISQRGLARMTNERMMFWSCSMRLRRCVADDSRGTSLSNTGRYAASSLDAWIFVLNRNTSCNNALGFPYLKSSRNRQTVVANMKSGNAISTSLWKSSSLGHFSPSLSLSSSEAKISYSSRTRFSSSLEVQRDVAPG